MPLLSLQVFLRHLFVACLTTVVDASTPVATCNSGLQFYKHSIEKSIDPIQVKNCNLFYCNAHVSLQATYCGGTTCATDLEAASCFQHWSETGRYDSSFHSVFNLDDCNYPIHYKKNNPTNLHPFTSNQVTMW